MHISFQSSSSNSWSSDESAGHLTVPLRSLAVGKEVTFHVPTTNVSGLNWMGSASENKDGEPRPPGDTHIPLRVENILIQSFTLISDPRSEAAAQD